MNIRYFRATRWLIGLLIVGLSAPSFANKPIPSPVRKSVGDAIEFAVEPELAKATRNADGYVWTKHISHPGASFIKLHFTDFNLLPDDRLVVLNAKGREVETLQLQGPKSRINFWGLSAQGDSTTLRFEFKQTYDRLPFSIDRMVLGDAELFNAPLPTDSRSICSPAEFDDAICYENEPGKWSNVQASVGVMSMGGNAETALFCSGSNVSSSNIILTNQHCVETQLQCDNTEYVFKYYRTGCNIGAPTTSDWQSFRCDEMLASEPFVNCDAGPGDLDFALTSVLDGDPSSTFGFADVDTTPVVNGDEIYIVQHPAGRPHEITVGSGADVQVTGSVLRYYNTLDTEGGSSGSPIYRASDDKLIGLHHCGGCSTAGVGNRGMLMSDIAPLIQPFLCTDALELRYQGGQDLLEISGDGDTVVEPGETWQFSASVRNASCAADATDVVGMVTLNSSVSDAIVISNATLNFGTIAAGGIASSGNVIFEVPTDATCSADISFDFVGLTDTGGTNFDDVQNAYSVPTGSVPVTQEFSDSFDAGLANWTVVDGGSGAGPAATWTTDNPGGRSISMVAPFIIVDSDSLGTGDTMDEELISIPIDVTNTSNLSLQFTHEFNFYSGGMSEQADVDVRSSATNGNWVNIENYSTADTSGVVTIDITAYKASDLQVRFHYYDAQYEWWWALDDIMLLSDDGFVCDIFGLSDDDEDGIANSQDNCLNVANTDQRDTDNDGFGNMCDPDFDNNGIVNFLDISSWTPLFGTAGTGDFDLDGDGQLNFIDYAILTSFFGNPPGPSGIVP